MLLKRGWDIRRVTSRESQKRAEWHQRELRQWGILKTWNPELVLDIGANTGQFAALVRQLLPTTQIVSFEPLQSCFDELMNRTDQLSPIRCYHCALGEKNETSQIFRNESSPSSSLLEMQELHKAEIPETSRTSAETIQIRRLDDLSEELSLPNNVVAKIDVQGYTSPVLRGGEKTLRKCRAIIAEVSLQPLYRGETTFDEAYEMLTGWGFRYQGNIDQWVSRRDGRILQCDCIFERVQENDPDTSETLSRQK
jgi:FkbM family methyltransferase